MTPREIVWELNKYELSLPFYKRYLERINLPIPPVNIRALKYVLNEKGY